MSNSGYAIKLGHHELSEARMELDTARRLAQELLRDTVSLTKQRDELLDACKAALGVLELVSPANPKTEGMLRAAIANATVTKP